MTKICFTLLREDEELDNVAGGTPGETADDSRFLNVLLQGTTKYHQCDRYGAWRIFFEKSASNDVKAAWRSLGIELVEDPTNSNKYYLGKKDIPRHEAWAHAEKLVGKHLTKEQWNW